MAKERERCSVCAGEGGYWEERNGKKGQERVWAICGPCGGTG